jgi:glutamate/tyrosine decarboxylase-like PLP-dependent enzyme
MDAAETRKRFEVFKNQQSVKETMDVLTQVIQKLYEQDPHHKIEDPKEHILNELGIRLPKKQQYLETDPDFGQLHQENEDLRHEVLKLEN